MRLFDGFGRAIGLAMAGKRNPWGKPSGDGGGDSGDGSGDESGEGTGGDSDGEPAPKGPRNPWLKPGSGGKGRRSASIEDIFRQRGPEGPRREGGPGGGGFRFPQRPDGKSWLPLALAAIFGVWLLVTSVHRVSPGEKAIVTWLGGKYSRTLEPGLNFTLPWPVNVVATENVSQIRSQTIPAGNEERLILTGDQNLVDLSYLIRWNIKNLKQFKYQLAEPVDTVSEVAEAAMRATVAEMDLDSVLSGAGRAEIETNVRAIMQGILDAYGSGVAVKGVEVVKTGPPEQVVEAFKDVSAAQQDADAAINRAQAYAQQVLARAQGDAESFDRIYAEYRQAPRVTRQRLYYETMEAVLSQTDKTIIEADGVVPYLPLPGVRRDSSSQRSATPAAPKAEGQ